MVKTGLSFSVTNELGFVNFSIMLARSTGKVGK